MSENSPPVVKLPATPGKPSVAPGTNSWAQTIEKQKLAMKEQEDLRATHRERYENKPVPPPPAGESVNSTHHRLPSKQYIQPAIPLVDPSGNQKFRAVTEPVASKTAFATRRPSVSQLRKKFSNSKKESPNVQHPEPGLPSPSSKAAQLLGMYPASNNKRITPPASVPQASNILDSACVSSTGSFEDSKAQQQTHSTPIFTRLQTQSNEVSAISRGREAGEPNVGAEGSETLDERTSSTQEPISTIKYELVGPNFPMYGNVPENAVQQKKGIHRVESFQAVIEHASSAVGSEGRIDLGPSDNMSQSTNTHVRRVEELMPPTIYSPSNCGGVWENDPAVGYSLPPFSPFTKNLSNDPVETSEFSNPYVDNSGLRQDYNGKPASINHPKSHYANGISHRGHGRMADYQAPLPSANSWASGSRANSFMSTNPPHWPDHHINNSVPSPPPTQHDYQRPTPVSPGMAQLDLRLHHHIDTAFNALSRLVADKHDRAQDQIIRRLENMDHELSRGFKNIRSEMQNLKRDVGVLQDSVRDVRKGTENIVGLIGGLEGKLEVLEKRISEQSCNCQRSPTEQSLSQHSNDRVQHRIAAHRRTESAHGALGQGESRPQYHSGASRSSSKGHPGETSSRRHRSSTLSSQVGTAVSDAGDSKKGNHVDYGSTRGQMPDLRDHPAYAHHHRGGDLVYNSDGLPLGLAISNGAPYATQPLVNGGWYQQAYGQGH